MTCRNCGHIYPIQNGIPNMVSRADDETPKLTISCLPSTRFPAEPVCLYINMHCEP